MAEQKSAERMGIVGGCVGRNSVERVWSGREGVERRERLWRGR